MIINNGISDNNNWRTRSVCAGNSTFYSVISRQFLHTFPFNFLNQFHFPKHIEMNQQISPNSEVRSPKEYKSLTGNKCDFKLTASRINREWYQREARCRHQPETNHIFSFSFVPWRSTKLLAKLDAAHHKIDPSSI
jgi:hypothetical protein